MVDKEKILWYIYTCVSFCICGCLKSNQSSGCTCKNGHRTLFYARAPSKDLKFHAGMNILLDTHFCLCFSRLSSQGNLLHGTHRYSDALRHEETYRSGSQIRKARRKRRNLHRQTRTVRKAVHGVYYSSTRVVVN